MPLSQQAVAQRPVFLTLGLDVALIVVAQNYSDRACALLANDTIADFGPNSEGEVREKCPGEREIWLEAGRLAGRRSSQVFTGTPNNTREPARSGKKKPQPRTVGVDVLVEIRGR